MKSRKQYVPKPGKKRRTFSKKRRFPKIKPGADLSLKKVFASIGIPDKTPFKPDPFRTLFNLKRCRLWNIQIVL